MKAVFLRFECPKCASRTFGSTIAPDNSVVHNCNSCGFLWPREESYKYFILIGEFKSQQEFETAYKFMNPPGEAQQVCPPESTHQKSANPFPPLDFTGVQKIPGGKPTKP